MKHLFRALFVLHSIAIPDARAATRLKELISLEGVRDNQLMGYGLVVGLAGTGDRQQSVFSAQSVTNLLERIDRKSTRLNSSHLGISYAVFCLKKKKKKQ